MTYESSNLSAISYANGFTMWHYRTPDWLATVCEDGYFNDAHKMLRGGDFMIVNAGIEDEPENAMLIVSPLITPDGDMIMRMTTPASTKP